VVKRLATLFLSKKFGFAETPRIGATPNFLSTRERVPQMTDAQFNTLIASIESMDQWTLDPSLFYIGAMLFGFALIFSA
jgi:hypothetical protein